MSNQKENKVSLQDSLKNYFKGVRAEWGKISWPQKPQIVSETIIVFIVVVFFTLFTYIVDLIFKGLLGLIPQ